MRRRVESVGALAISVAQSAIGRIAMAAESCRMADRPCGEQAALDGEFRGVDETSGDQVIDAAHEVTEIVAGEARADQVAELLAVAGSAARVGAEDDEAAGCEELRAGRKSGPHMRRGSSSISTRSGYFFAGQSWRLDDPGLNHLAVGGVRISPVSPVRVRRAVSDWARRGDGFGGQVDREGEQLGGRADGDGAAGIGDGEFAEAVSRGGHLATLPSLRAAYTRVAPWSSLRK